MQKIFISYRRGDSEDVTGRVFDRLVAQFGKPSIFKDVDSIPLGVDFRKHLSEVVSQCQVLLAVIGDQWLQAKNETGQKRLDNPSDFVRIEIEAALARGIPVIPVLVGKVATMPAETELPASLGPLAYHNGLRVRPDPDFHRDMDRLNTALQEHLEVKAGEPKASTPQLQQAQPSKLPAATELLPTVAELSPQPVPAGPTNWEPTPDESKAAEEAVRKATVPNQGGVNAMEGFRSLHAACPGRELPALCRMLPFPDKRYGAIGLLTLAMRQPEARPYISKALDQIVECGVLEHGRGHVSDLIQTAALEAIMQAPCPPADKWRTLFPALSLANDQQLGKIVPKLIQVTPPAERQRTGAALTEMMDHLTDPNLVHAVCQAIGSIGYRAGIPRMIAMLETATPERASPVVTLLVSWRVREAATAIRQVIEFARYGTSYQLPTLMGGMYSLEGPVCAPYLAEVLRDALAPTQANILNPYALKAVNDEVVLEVVTGLARTSFDDTVKQAATNFLKNRGRAV